MFRTQIVRLGLAFVISVTLSITSANANEILSIFDTIAAQVTQMTKITNLDSVRTWPNPYNPTPDSEYINFNNLPADTGMTIEIYDIRGNKIVALAVGYGITMQENQNVGRWDGKYDSNHKAAGRLVASGVYLYVVKSQMGTTVRKFTLIRGERK